MKAVANGVKISKGVIMNIAMMRSEIIKSYPGESWKKKVKNMPENQVIAIYNNLKKTDHLGKPKIKEHDEQPHFTQLTFDTLYRRL